jgi:hypothetical protein
MTLLKRTLNCVLIYAVMVHYWVNTLVLLVRKLSSLVCTIRIELRIVFHTLLQINVVKASIQPIWNVHLIYLEILLEGQTQVIMPTLVDIYCLGYPKFIIFSVCLKKIIFCLAWLVGVCLLFQSKLLQEFFNQHLQFYFCNFHLRLQT